MSAVYRVTEPVRRISREVAREFRLHDTYPDQSASVRETVREMRLVDLERTWQERYLSAFDHLVLMWHRFDPQLYLHLEDAPRLRAVEILRRDGWLS